MNTSNCVIANSHLCIIIFFFFFLETVVCRHIFCLSIFGVRDFFHIRHSMRRVFSSLSAAVLRTSPSARRTSTSIFSAATIDTALRMRSSVPSRILSGALCSTSSSSIGKKKSAQCVTAAMFGTGRAHQKALHQRRKRMTTRGTSERNRRPQIALKIPP